MEQKSSNGVSTSRLRILLLAPNCDPTDVSIPFVTYSHAAALAELHDVTLVVGSPFEDRVRERRRKLSQHRSGPHANAPAHL